MRYERSHLLLHWFFCIFFYLITALSLAPKAHAAPIIDQWPAIKEAYFNQQTVIDAQNQMVLDAPVQAENAAIVPFSFSVNLTQATIKKIYVFTDANPILLTATFMPSKPSKQFKLATRIRLDKNSVVRVLVENSFGQLLMKTINIKTPGGGCGGGIMTDEAKLRASAGKMKMRFIKQSADKYAAMVLNIKHTMRTGFQRTFQGYYAKAWFIQDVDIKRNDQPYLKAVLGPGISADPYLKFGFSEGITIKQVEVTLKDNEGKAFSKTFYENLIQVIN